MCYPGNAIREYVAIFLQAKLAASHISNFLGVFFVTFPGLTSIMLYFTLAYNGPWLERMFTFAVAAAFAACISFFSYELGQFAVMSHGLIEDWESNYLIHKKKGVMFWEKEERVVKSLQQIRFHIARCIFVDQKTLLAVWDTIIDKTIFLICLYPLS